MFYALFDVSLNKKEKKKTIFHRQTHSISFPLVIFSDYFFSKIFFSKFTNISNNFYVKKILQFPMQLKSDEN